MLQAPVVGGGEGTSSTTDSNEACFESGAAPAEAGGEAAAVATVTMATPKWAQP